MDIDKLSEELEKIYENCCHPKREEKMKCLALDEQELALIHMCLKILGSENGFDADDYTTKDLFILLKTCKLGTDECKEKRVADQPMKYKRFNYRMGYSIENVSEVLLVYYAVLLLYANENNTLEYRNKSERSYFKVYAFFACICPKTYNILLFNQIYLFMVKSCDCSLNTLKQYLISTNELWSEYNELMDESKREEILGNLISRFREIIAYDENSLYTNTGKLFDLIDEGFLAFDFMAGDTIPEARFGKIVNGTEYFECYLKFIKKELIKNEVKDEVIYKYIECILENVNRVKTYFCRLMNDVGAHLQNIAINFTEINDLLRKFENYCDEESIKLLEVKG